MKTSLKEITISTKSRIQLIDITGQVEELVRNAGVTNGICLIFSLHSTTAVVINENEKGLLSDIVRKVSEEFPKGAGWSHDRIDDNADAHLASTFIGSSRALPIIGGGLMRGTWQSIFLLELDGPRTRTLIVEVIGE
ncbi:secondary thiamine-phosphate synthase enzyme YjbQ [Candidatus Bathyarchaeota archaeon]|nr:secondary thiamine-phosphate synthase enzyme YjbQ [Candidatus Bathyarchaeota archaeon]